MYIDIYSDSNVWGLEIATHIINYYGWKQRIDTGVLDLQEYYENYKSYKL